MWNNRWILTLNQPVIFRTQACSRLKPTKVFNKKNSGYGNIHTNASSWTLYVYAEIDSEYKITHKLSCNDIVLLSDTWLPLRFDRKCMKNIISYFWILFVSKLSNDKKRKTKICPLTSWSIPQYHLALDNVAFYVAHSQARDSILYQWIYNNDTWLAA